MFELWNNEADSIRVKLLAEGRTYGEVAAELNEIFGTDKYTKDSVRGRARRTNTSYSEVVPPAEYTSMEERWNSFCDMIGAKRANMVVKNPITDTAKFIVLSDMHCPTHNPQALLDIVEGVRGDIKTCVVAGDFMDTGAFSPHFQFNKLDPIAEIQACKVVAKYLDDAFENVIYVFGNHECWYNKAKSKLPKEFQYLLKDYLIEYVVADLPNSHTIPEFFTQIGDCVVGHPSMFRQKRMSDVIASYEYFNNWHQRLQLRPIRAYVHAHTHKLGSLMMESSGKMVKLFEGGALCLPSEHLSVGHVVNYAPPTEGYIIITQDGEGNTIFNESREFYIEPSKSYARGQKKGSWYVIK